MVRTWSPTQGGAAIAFELLFHHYVDRIYINDLSRPIYAFWNSVLNNTDKLCELVRNVPLTIDVWDRQKRCFAAGDFADELELGFATFFLNRTNRSGILNGGIIGGRAQAGQWKIDARFNKEELIHRIQSIAKLRDRIKLCCLDATEFIKIYLAEWGPQTLIYLDPPYYKKGRDLYYDYYNHQDHEQIAKIVTQTLHNVNWIVSYDNTPEIRALCAKSRFRMYGIGYSARKVGEGSEIMFFSDGLTIGPLVGCVKVPGDETFAAR